MHAVNGLIRASVPFAMAVYAVNFALPLGFCLFNRYWLAVFAGVTAVLAAWFGFGRFLLWHSAGGFDAKPVQWQKSDKDQEEIVGARGSVLHCSVNYPT